MGYKKLDLNGKVAVVIGGSSGIGRTLARGLAEAGADVVPSSRRLELVNVIADEIESLGRRSLRVSCDVADRDRWPKCCRLLSRRSGRWISWLMPPDSTSALRHWTFPMLTGTGSSIRT